MCLKILILKWKRPKFTILAKSLGKGVNCRINQNKNLVLRSLSMKAELNHFDRAIWIHLEIFLDSENLAEVFERKMLQISTNKK